MLYRQLARVVRGTCVPRYCSSSSSYRCSVYVTAALAIHQRHHTSGSSSSSSSSFASSHSISAADLQHAFDVLGLAPSCTDVEIKSAFQRYAKLHHPDLAEEDAGQEGHTSTREAGAGSSAATQSERMIAGTEAYQLLRRLTPEERRFILREGVLYKHRRSHNGKDDGGGGRGDGGFTAEQRARAERAYYGSSRRPRSTSGTYTPHNSNNNYNYNSSHEGSEYRRASETAERDWSASQTAAFNQYQARARAMQGHKMNTNSYYDQDNNHSSGRRGGGGSSSSSNPHRRLFSGQGFSLYFFGVSREELRRLREEQRTKTPGFAGIDGSRYDSPANAARARVHPTLLDPTLRALCLMRQRAQERLVVDRALGYPLLLSLTVVVVVAGLVLLRAQWRAMRARHARFASLIAQEEKEEEEEKEKEKRVGETGRTSHDAAIERAAAAAAAPQRVQETKEEKGKDGAATAAAAGQSSATAVVHGTVIAT